MPGREMRRVQGGDSGWRERERERGGEGGERKRRSPSESLAMPDPSLSLASLAYKAALSTSRFRV